MTSDINSRVTETNMVGSSETICETTFKFEEYRKIMPIHKEKIDQDFLEYFVGLVEGSEPFLIDVGSSQVSFQLDHIKEDAKYLKKLRTKLGFGSIVQHPTSTQTLVYTVSHEESLLKLISILNGNLCYIRQQERFKLFLEVFNKQHKRSIALKENKSKISLDNAWLSGFIDARGLFSGHFKYYPEEKQLPRDFRPPKGFLSFHISCDIVTLKQIRGLFVRANNGMKNIKSRKNEGHDPTLEMGSKAFRKKIIPYIQEYKLKTYKSRIFQAWENVHTFLDDNDHEGLDKQGIKTMFKLLRRIR